MSVSVAELVSVTSILLAVCVLAILTLATVCRLLVAYRANTTQPYQGHSAEEASTSCSRQQQELCQLIQDRGPDYKTQEQHISQDCQGPTDAKTDCHSDIYCTSGVLGAIESAISDIEKSYSAEPDTSTDKNTNSEAESETSWLAMQSPIGGATIQRALSCDSVLSDTSVNEPDDMETSLSHVGQLEFSLQYIRDSKELVIMVIQARNLERDQITGSLDSYVRVSITHYTGSRSQTRVVRDTLNPQFLDCFTYHVEPEVLFIDSTTSPVITFQVFSCDKYARHRLLGETELRLLNVDLQKNEQAVQICMNLHEIDERPLERGSVLMSLSYLPTAERLILVLVKARNLCLPTTKPTGDCCFKVYQQQNGQRVAKKKTSYKHDDQNPIFNEAMIFSLPRHQVDTVQLKIAAIVVLPGDRGATCIGHVTIGPQVTGTQLVHWTQAMTSLRRPVTMWHSLR